MMSLQKSNIEYLTHGWPFMTGCRHDKQICPVADDCWAKSMAVRFRKGDFEPRLKPELLLSPLSLKNPARIGVCFTGDLFGDWVDPERPVDPEDNTLKDIVKRVVRARPEHRFLFLTKNPSGYLKWGKWPGNAWLGASVCSNGMMTKALTNLASISSGHKWLSIEPLLGMVGMSDHMSLKHTGIEWVVIGAQSGRHPVMPDISWVHEIVEACDQAGIRIWLKDNLKPLLLPNQKGQPNGLMIDCFWQDERAKMRQELPEGLRIG